MSTNHSTQSKRTLLEFLKLNASDKDIAAILADYSNGLVSIQDGTIRTIQQANAVTELDLFEARNEKRDGIYSLSKAQLDKGVGFAVTGIQLLAYQATTSNGMGGQVPQALATGSQAEIDAMLDADKFGSIQAFPAISNGELEIRVNRKPVLDKLALSVFNNVAPNGQSVGRAGFYKLSNPIFIKPEVPLEVLLRFPNATPGSTLIECLFYGASTLAT